MRVIRNIAAALLAAGTACLLFGSPDDSLFPVPDILKKNVAFWKKIYTEVSLSEGVIHDASYPLVIFKKLGDNPSSATIRREKEAVAQSLQTIATQPESTWTAAERSIVELYKAGADSSALSGAVERVRFQRGQKERFIEGLVRSGFFIDTIRAIFRAYSIPERVAYLPHVESSFNTAAYSRVGAAGLWQFMRRTGKLFGMKINYTIDERRDPVRARIAAAEYLSKSYARLGSWPLAITSYNHGVEGMSRAVAQTGSNDISQIMERYQSPSFQFASRNFYCCFLAVSELAENCRANFPDVEPLSPLKWSDITLEFFVTPDIICKYLNITPVQLSAYNPAVRPVIFSHNRQLPKGMVLHLPGDLPRSAAMLALGGVPDSLKSSEAERPRYYNVRRGDNLFGIAAVLGVTVQELALENDLAGSMRIHAGQVLRVPAKGAALVAAAPATPAQAVPVAGEQIPKPDSAPLLALAAPDRARVSGGVAPGAVVARKEAAPPEQVKKKALQETTAVLGLSPSRTTVLKFDSLKVLAMAPALPENETAGVPQQTRPQAETGGFDATLYDLGATAAPDGKSAEIRVSVDETMSHYCDWLKVGAWRIRELSGLGRGGTIRIGQRLRIPLSGEGELEAFNSTRLEYHLALEEDFYSQYKVVDVKQYAVAAGDNLWSLCNQGDNQVPMWLFKKYNKQVDLSMLMPGDIVQLPLTEEKAAADGPDVGEQVENQIHRPFIQPVRTFVSPAQRVP